MTAQVKSTNGALAAGVGILMLIGSLFATWFHLTGLAVIRRLDDFPIVTGGMVRSAKEDISGFEGTIGIGFDLPIWVVVALGIVALALLILNALHLTNLSAVYLLLPFAASALGSLWALAWAASADGVTPGLGLWLCLVGLGTGLLGVFKPRRMAPSVPFNHPTE